MKKLILIFVLFSIIFSCKDDNNIKYKYFDDGKVMQKLDLNTRKAYAYYNNSKLKYISDTDGKYLHGKFISYYENGELKDSGYYNKNIQTGTWYYFNEFGILEKKCTYQYVFDKGNLLNEIVYFNKDGDTLLDRGHHYRLEFLKDTISLNDTLKFDIIIERSVFNDSCGVLIANYDSIYNLTDTCNRNIFPSSDNLIKCYTVSKSIGANIVRGVIFDYTTRNDSDLYRKLYFSKEYYVKPE